MTTLLEDPMPVAVIGGVLSLVALIVFWSRRDSMSLAALAGAVVVTLGPASTSSRWRSPTRNMSNVPLWTPIDMRSVT